MTDDQFYNETEYLDEPSEEVPDEWQTCHECRGSGTAMSPRWSTGRELGPPEEVNCRKCGGRGGWIVDLDDYRYPDQDYDGPWDYDYQDPY